MIPEITESQFALMQSVCRDPEMSVFSQCSSKEGDSVEAAIILDQAKKDTEYMCELGLLKNLTADHQERLDELNARSGRTWNVFEITKVGRTMFQASTSKESN